MLVLYFMWIVQNLHQAAFQRLQTCTWESKFLNYFLTLIKIWKATSFRILFPDTLIRLAADSVRKINQASANCG